MITALYLLTKFLGGAILPRASNYNEENISQKPALEVLKKLGYRYISTDEAVQQRGNLYNCILKDILQEQLIDLNSFEYKGKTYKFSDKNINQAIKDIDEPLSGGLVNANENIYDSLLLGESYRNIT